MEAANKKKIVTIHEAKTHLSRFVARAAAGEEIVIARGDRPMARLVPLLPTRQDRVPGTARGEIWVADDFSQPLPEEDLGAFTQGPGRSSGSGVATVPNNLIGH